MDEVETETDTESEADMGLEEMNVMFRPNIIWIPYRPS